jgi:hypothetical protein
VSRLRIAATPAARPDANPETMGHERILRARAAYVPKLPVSARQ